MDDYYITSQFPKSEQPSSSESGQRNVTLAKAIEDFFEDEKARGLLDTSIEKVHLYIDPLLTIKDLDSIPNPRSPG